MFEVDRNNPDYNSLTDTDKELLEAYVRRRNSVILRGCRHFIGTMTLATSIYTYQAHEASSSGNFEAIVKWHLLAPLIFLAAVFADCASTIPIVHLNKVLEGSGSDLRLGETHPNMPIEPKASDLFSVRAIKSHLVGTLISAIIPPFGIAKGVTSIHAVCNNLYYFAAIKHGHYPRLSIKSQENGSNDS